MGRILINASSSTAGGGITYLRNVLPRLAADGRHQFTVFVPEETIEGLAVPIGGSVTLKPVRRRPAMSRMAWEQFGLVRFVRRNRIDAVISIGNFALARCPVPQILFSRNDLYFSADYERDLRSRGSWRDVIALKLKRRLAIASIRAASENVVATAAFGEKVRRAALLDREPAVIPFGFDRAAVAQASLTATQQQELARGRGRKRILLVSHYNYFRNFETLLRAVALINASERERVQLVLTTNLQRGANYGGYDATRASDLVDRLGIRDDIAMLGAVPYESVHAVYEACDVFVFPSYAESFGHPMLEAMAAGLPVIAADLPVHREVCGDAALYFAVFDEHALAEQCRQVLHRGQVRDTLKARGLQRASVFSWDHHVQRLIEVVDHMLGTTAVQEKSRGPRPRRMSNVH